MTSPYRDVAPPARIHRVPIIQALLIGAAVGFAMGLLTSSLPALVGVLLDLLVLSLVGIAIVVTGAFS